MKLVNNRFNISVIISTRLKKFVYIFGNHDFSICYQLMEMLVYTPNGCHHCVIEKGWFFWELYLVYSQKIYLLFNNNNTFEKLYNTRALQHVRINVDFVSFEKPWDDMIFIRILGITNPDKSLNFIFQNCCCKPKQINFVVLCTYNQDKVNYKLMNKWHILSIYTQLPSYYY